MTPQEVEELVIQFKEMGYDAIKVLSVSDKTTFRALVKASRKHRLPMFGHISPNIGLWATLDCKRYLSIEHLEGYFRLLKEGEQAIIDGIIETSIAGVYNCATLDFYTVGTRSLETLEAQAGLEYATEKQLKEWRNVYKQRQKGKDEETSARELAKALHYKRIRLSLIRALYDSNAPLLVSPDATSIFSMPGFSLLRELKLHEEAGIPRVDVLRIATQSAAKFVGEDKYGGIKKGQKANLLLLGADPLQTLSNLSQVKGVYTNGQWHTKEALEAKLKALQSVEK